MRKLLLAAGGAAVAAALQASQALACGGLVAPDGDVRLDKATTFVAFHDGVEHYITSFAYSGSAVDVGWIVPLPAVPESIQAAGRWTLQRLEREFQPPIAFEALSGASAPVADKSIVVEQVQVEALDVTVLKGSGAAVVDWCIHNGFLLPAETRAHLLQYARGTPVFMAAKYDTAAAQQRGQLTGDGTPLLITMRTPRLWVPLEVLANDDSPVIADLFLLTDQPLRTYGTDVLTASGATPASVDGAPGFVIRKQEPMNQLLFENLSSDRNMSWVPPVGYVTYLTLNASSSQVTYDLNAGSDNVIRLTSFGTGTPDAAGSATPGPPDAPAILFAMLLIALALIIAVPLGGVAWHRSRGRATAD